MFLCFFVCLFVCLFTYLLFTLQGVGDNTVMQYPIRSFSMGLKLSQDWKKEEQFRGEKKGAGPYTETSP